MASRVTSPILIGRESELAAVRAVLDAAGRDEPAIALVGGEAGVGKTRLVSEVAADARSGGWTILHGGCVSVGSDEGLPFAPIAEALRGLVRDVGIEGLVPHLDAATAELARLVPQLADPSVHEPPTGRPDWAQTRIFEGLLALLDRLARTKPVLLVLEDLHWADRSTRDLVAFLARTLTRERLAIVGTYRSDELHRRHPLRPWLAEMDRLPRVTRLDVERLRPADVRRQLAAILDREAPTELVEEIARRSAGNPFFAEELLAAGTSRAAGERIPDTLREVLLSRVRTLSDDAQEVLACAAVAGASFRHDLLRDCAATTVEACARDELALSAALRAAVAAQLLVVDPDEPDGYAFRHALLQEAVEDDVLPADRRRYHARYAAILAERPVEPGAAGASQLAALAAHAAAAHELALALRGWIGAARASLAVYATAEAGHAYERAMELWDAVPADDRPGGVDFVDLSYEATLAYIGAGELVRARDVIGLAVDRLDATGDPVRGALLRERRARTLWMNGELVTAIGIMDEAVALVRDLPPTADTVRVMASRAGILVLADQMTRAVEAGEEALELAEAIGADGIRAYVLSGLGVALVSQGQADRGLVLLREGLRLAHELGLDAIDFHRAYANLSTGLEDCGRLEESVAVALEGVEWARARGMWRLQGVFLEANAASALIALGRTAEARRLLDLRDRPRPQGVALLNHAVVSGAFYVRSGDIEAAREILVAAREAIRRLRDAQFTGPIYVGLAELAIADGRSADVEADVDEALERLAETENTGRRHRVELQALALRAIRLRLESRREDGDPEARALRERAALCWSAIEREIQAADRMAEGNRIDTVGHGLVAAAELAAIRREGAAPAWGRAAAHWAAHGRPYQLAVARLHEAEAILAATRSRVAATPPLAEVATLAASLGARPLADAAAALARMARIDLPAAAVPAPVAAPHDGGAGTAAAEAAPEPAERPFGLTPRELEVIPLIVDGYSNRRIAEALFISESTAGVHVSNILGKLGVGTRVEAAAIAVRTGLA